MLIHTEYLAGTAGVDFTPHVITVAAGEVCHLFGHLLKLLSAVSLSVNVNVNLRNLNNVIWRMSFQIGNSVSHTS